MMEELRQGFGSARLSFVGWSERTTVTSHSPRLLSCQERGGGGEKQKCAKSVQFHTFFFCPICKWQLTKCDSLDAKHTCLTLLDVKEKFKNNNKTTLSIHSGTDEWCCWLIDSFDRNNGQPVVLWRRCLWQSRWLSHENTVHTLVPRCNVTFAERRERPQAGCNLELGAAMTSWDAWGRWVWEPVKPSRCVSLRRFWRIRSRSDKTKFFVCLLFI